MSTKPALFSAIDIGTSSTKCVVSDPDAPGNSRVLGSLPTPISRPGPGIVEGDPQGVLDACLGLLETLLRFSVEHQQPIASLGLTGFVGSAICLDHTGASMKPCAIWQDQRCAPQSDEFFRWPRERIRAIHGIDLPCGVCWPGPKIRWLRENQPNVLADAWKIVQIKDYLFLKLTALPYSEARTFIGLANILESRWDDEALNWCGVRPDQLPELRRANETFAMAPSWRSHFSFYPWPLPMIGIGTADMTAAFIGCLLEAGEGALLANTAEIMSVAVPSHDTAPTAPGVIRVPYRQGLDLIYGSTTNGAACIDWFQQAFGPVDLPAITAQAESIPSGSDGVLFLPYLIGERAPIWNERATGAFIGLRANHTKAHLFRAILEGCSFSKRHVLQCIGQSRRASLHAVVVCGGTARIPLWNQIRASVLGLPMQVDACGESSALGAMFLAAEPTDPSFLREYRKNLVRTTQAPVPHWVQAYNQSYERYIELSSMAAQFWRK